MIWRDINKTVPFDYKNNLKEADEYSHRINFINKLHNIYYDFYLGGSRFFGLHNNKSDCDFIINLSEFEKIEKTLISFGFEQQKGQQYAVVVMKSRYVDILFVEDIRVNFAIQNLLLNKYFNLIKEHPKSRISLINVISRYFYLDKMNKSTTQTDLDEIANYAVPVDILLMLKEKINAAFPDLTCDYEIIANAYGRIFVKYENDRYINIHIISGMIKVYHHHRVIINTNPSADVTTNGEYYVSLSDPNCFDFVIDKIRYEQILLEKYDDRRKVESDRPRHEFC